MNLQRIELSQVLARREARVARQRELLEKYKRPLVCLCMNIPGDIKRTPAVDMLFESGARRMLRAVLGASFLHIEDSCSDSASYPSLMHAEYYYAATGPEAFLVFDGISARSLKEIAVNVEEAEPEARLFDLDIIDEKGLKLSRNTPRTCIVCGKPANYCAPSRAHDLGQLRRATDELIADWLADSLAAAASAAIDEEAELTPKPGLVDAANSGAHSDMDLALLKLSSAAIEPYFREIAYKSFIGEASIEELTRIGVEAEAAMLETCGGVNTHRGAIFAFSVYIAALARALASGEAAITIARSLVEEKFREAEPGEESHGQLVKRKYGSGGAAEHAMQGFPSALKARRTIIETGDKLLALCGIMKELSDSNLLYRGGSEGLEYVRERAAEIEIMGPEDRICALKDMDEECIKRNLSPGGAADMLALAIFLSDFGDSLLGEAQ